MLKKKIWANFQRLYNFLPKKLLLSSQKYGFGIRGPGPRLNLFRMCRNSVHSLLEAMRDLLGNIHVAEAPAEAGDEASDDEVQPG
jgi:hypothetical protein